MVETISPHPSDSAGPESAPSGVTPLWVELLAERGLSRETMAHFQITPRNQGWSYPVHPDYEARRWKAFDSDASPKYLWLPNKPEGLRFYDVDGRLRHHIAQADRALWLASGEADVWALWEGGIRNATCLFDGEARHMPEWFVAELRYLGVRALQLAPDRDQPGITFAGNVCEALWHSQIEPVAYRLPFEMGSKADIGDLLLKVGREGLREALDRLPQVAQLCEGSEPRFVQRPLPHFSLRDREHHGDAWELYDRWRVEVVEPAAVRTWGLSAPDSRGFSKNFCCPFHPDRHPSAGWNYNTHGVYCFACGSHNSQEVAQALGVQSWEDYKAEQMAARQSGA